MADAKTAVKNLKRFLVWKASASTVLMLQEAYLNWVMSI
jgi:hypothetical protein